MVAKEGRGGGADGKGAAATAAEKRASRPVREGFARRDAKALSRAVFDAQAADYDRSAKGAHARRLYPAMLGEIVRFCERREVCRVLDMGCGTGALAAFVADAAPHAVLSGIDLSPAMVAAARARLAGRAAVEVGDAESLPFHDEAFDLVYCNDSFHHYPDARKAAFQAWRVLAPGGRLIVGDCWLPAPFRAIMNAAMPYGGEGDVRMRSEGELRAVLGAWFSEVSWHREGWTACVAVACK